MPVSLQKISEMAIPGYAPGLLSSAHFGASPKLENYPQIAYTNMKAVFVELPPFQRHRETYLDDEAYRRFQADLLRNPEAGDVIQGTSGLRKVRFADARRGRGKRGGLRVIYYWKISDNQFWLFTIYDKDEVSDLTADERKALARLLANELMARSIENDQAQSVC